MAAGTLPGGVTVEEQTEEEVEVSIVRITDEEGEKAVGKPRGSYVTLTAPHMAGSDPEIDKRCAKALAKQIRAMMPKKNKQRPVLLVGLGNRSMTPDSLGPRTLDHVMVTRHLFSLWPEDLQKAGNVCAISPGVLGETGIESGEAVFGIVQQVKPAVVIAVDTWQPLYSLAIPALRREAAWATDGWPWMKRRWACRYWRWACRWWCVPIHCLKEGSKG